MTVDQIEEPKTVEQEVPVKKVTRKRRPAVKKVEVKVEEKKAIPEKWAKARFHYVELPGATWSCRPNLKPERFVDGEVYERPIALFELLNENCRVVKRVKRPGTDTMPGEYIKTKAYTPRLYFEILERFEKEV